MSLQEVSHKVVGSVNPSFFHLYGVVGVVVVVAVVVVVVVVVEGGLTRTPFCCFLSAS